MNMKKITVIFVAALWAVLTAFAWFGPREDLSEAERRPLAQMPELSGKTLLSGSFMEDFEDFTLDQFPLRDGFRTLKALFHSHILGQKDNNGIYIEDGYAVKQEYPLKEDSLMHAADRFNWVCEKYLTDSDVYFAIVPDKGQYLAENSGHLTLDYAEMSGFFRKNLPFATHIDLLDSLNYEDFYRTDTHWRQENLFEAAKNICACLNVTAPSREDYTQTAIDRPFYGVYYGQAALPMEPETLYILESQLLKDCAVYDHESGQTGAIYDRTKLDSKDLYDIFLSGSRSLLTIVNPGAKTDRELIVFRDSFGSAMIPLILTDYAKVTVVDIRYLHPALLERYIEFTGQDVLFLYSTLVLNNSETIK